MGVEGSYKEAASKVDILALGLCTTRRSSRGETGRDDGNDVQALSARILLPLLELPPAHISRQLFNIVSCR